MKSLRTIVPLFAISACIVVFWLMPGINTAGTTRYTRIYEDTDQPNVAALKASLEGPAGDTVKAKPEKSTKAYRKKKYKKESIEGGSKLSKIRPSMFSRAIHFSEEKIVIDSTTNPPATAKAVEEVEVKEKIEK